MKNVEGELTPKQIVAELDKYIIGQEKAKRSVAIALRNRFRRKNLPEDLRDEVAPKNIIMIGPTGVGKTEIARRLSNIAGAPFVKVEATKYTEVGYVGRDVESMIRDLTNGAVNDVKKEMSAEVESLAKQKAEEDLLDILLPPVSFPRKKPEVGSIASESIRTDPTGTEDKRKHTRERFREMLRRGELEQKIIEIEVKQPRTQVLGMFAGMGLEEMDQNISNMFGNVFPEKKKHKKMTVEEARKILEEEERDKLIDMDKVVKVAIERVEQMGIVFLDEIDKIAQKGTTHGPDVSREGVQRDILPIVEGATVSTKYGAVRTHHILFIAAGAFHMSKPSDLIPELQGRFPIRVELKSLTTKDLEKILVQPKNALVKQYFSLLETEGVKLEFKPDAIKEIAKIATFVNSQTENIGARRLYTIMELMLEDVSFTAPELDGQTIPITVKYVQEKLKDVLENKDLSKYIL
ncbi:MAG: ATP-dependent protease ATPase subunit HslU [Spirochaetota bacterium]|nr:MAG: ATP-dependent protease ATPase subunit HslU [Spirochaetota bacterium]